MHLRFTEALTIVAFSTALVTCEAQNLIVNGSFEAPVLTNWNAAVSTNSLWPWQTSAFSFEIWTNIFGFPSADGSQNLEIIASGGSQRVWQNFLTTPGADYSLSFFHSPRNGVDSVLTVSIDTNVIVSLFENGTVLDAADWHRFQTNFTARSVGTTLVFSDVSSYNGGTHVDGVVVERLPLTASIRCSEVEICWETVQSKTYQVEYEEASLLGHWSQLGTAFQGTGASICVKDTIPPGAPQRTYRVISVP